MNNEFVLSVEVTNSYIYVCVQSSIIISLCTRILFLKKAPFKAIIHQAVALLCVGN